LDHAKQHGEWEPNPQWGRGEHTRHHKKGVVKKPVTRDKKSCVDKNTYRWRNPTIKGGNHPLQHTMRSRKKRERKKR